MSQRTDDTLKGVIFLAFLALCIGYGAFTEWSGSRRAHALTKSADVEQLVSVYFPAGASGSEDSDGNVEIKFHINTLLNERFADFEAENKFLDVAYDLIPLAFAKAPNAALVHISADRTYVLKTGKEATVPWRGIFFERSVSDGMAWAKVEAQNLPDLAKRYWRFPGS